jgi:3D (Asp-Asp-Asp) domain-containing protein
VQTRAGISPARLAVTLAGVLTAAALPVAGGADPSASFADRARDLRAENASLAARSSSALLDLYALNSRLSAAKADLASLRRKVAALDRKRADVRLKLRLARRALEVSKVQLSERLHVLYVQGQADPVAVLLGSASLDDALARIDELNRTAKLNESVIEQALAARKALRALARSLAVQQVRVRRLETAASASAAALERALAERRGYIASLSSRKQLNASQIASLEIEAATARRRSQALAAAVPAYTAPHPEIDETSTAVAASQTLTVIATGYSMSGHTATGLRVGWGVVAVDPSVIPLGTRLTVPGYGQGVAADIGHAVQGATIDLWFPTRAQALGWGRRTVTIELH